MIEQTFQETILILKVTEGYFIADFFLKDQCLSYLKYNITKLIIFWKTFVFIGYNQAVLFRTSVKELANLLVNRLIEMCTNYKSINKGFFKGFIKMNI